MVPGFFTCLVFIFDAEDKEKDIAGINFLLGRRRRSTEVEGRKFKWNRLALGGRE